MFVNTPIVTASADLGGTVTPSGATTVEQGDSVAYTIAPGTGAQVGPVIVDGVAVGSRTGFTFSPSGTTVVTYDADQTYTITPAGGASVVDVLVDGQSVGAVESYAFENVTANHTITATFSSGDSGDPPVRSMWRLVKLGRRR